jgi:hypothetical protein
MERFAHTILGYHGCDARLPDSPEDADGEITAAVRDGGDAGRTILLWAHAVGAVGECDVVLAQRERDGAG